MIDDGLAIGATMSAARQAVRARYRAWLVCAVPVAALDSLGWVAPFVDEVLCVTAPLDFNAVGQCHECFERVADEKVVSLLAKAGTAVRLSACRQRGIQRTPSTGTLDNARTLVVTEPANSPCSANP